MGCLWRVLNKGASKTEPARVIWLCSVEDGLEGPSWRQGEQWRATSWSSWTILGLNRQGCGGRNEDSRGSCFLFTQKEKGTLPGVADAENAHAHVSWSGAIRLGAAKQAEAPVSWNIILPLSSASLCPLVAFLASSQEANWTPTRSVRLMWP